MSTPKSIAIVMTGNPVPAEPSKMSKEDQELKSLMVTLIGIQQTLSMGFLPMSGDPNMQSIGQGFVKLIDRKSECLTKIETILTSKAEIDIDYQLPGSKFTWLHIAFSMRLPRELGQLVLLRNPNPNLKDSAGYTALERGRTTRCPVNLLQEYQLKYNQQQKEKDKLSNSDTSSSAAAAAAINAAGTSAASSAASAPAALSDVGAPAASSAASESSAAAASASGVASAARTERGDSKQQGGVALTAYDRLVTEAPSLGERCEASVSASASASPSAADSVASAETKPEKVSAAAPVPMEADKPKPH